MRNDDTEMYGKIVNRAFEASGLSMEQFWEVMKEWPGASLDYHKKWFNGDEYKFVQVPRGWYYSIHIYVEKLDLYLNVYGHESKGYWSCKS